jgi:SAM-dependent methyltransferase
MSKRVKRPGVREGYDLWSETYDTTPNPLVLLDRRITLPALAAQPGEVVLDAGCGTGWYLRHLDAARSRALGLDFSRGMLRVARRSAPRSAVAQADLNRAFPVRASAFDAVVSALISEHLSDLHCFFRESFAALRRGGRLIFSAFHPELARAGVEANFERGHGVSIGRRTLHGGRLRQPHRGGGLSGGGVPRVRRRSALARGHAGGGEVPRPPAAAARPRPARRVVVQAFGAPQMNTDEHGGRYPARRSRDRLEAPHARLPASC